MNDNISNKQKLFVNNLELRYYQDVTMLVGILQMQKQIADKQPPQINKRIDFFLSLLTSLSKSIGVNNSEDLYNDTVNDARFKRQYKHLRVLVDYKYTTDCCFVNYNLKSEDKKLVQRRKLLAYSLYIKLEQMQDAIEKALKIRKIIA